jgi:hypothetical protein
LSDFSLAGITTFTLVKTENAEFFGSMLWLKNVMAKDATCFERLAYHRFGP